MCTLYTGLIQYHALNSIQKEKEQIQHVRIVVPFPCISWTEVQILHLICEYVPDGPETPTSTTFCRKYEAVARILSSLTSNTSPGFKN